MTSSKERTPSKSKIISPQKSNILFKTSPRMTAVQFTELLRSKFVVTPIINGFISKERAFQN